MSITFDTKNTYGHFGVSSANDTYVMGSGSHSILLVFMNGTSANGTSAQLRVSTCTYNGVSLTFLGRSESTSPQNVNCDCWYMIDPPSGSHTIATALGGTPSGRPNGWSISAVSYTATGTLAVSGFTANNSNSAASVTVTSATGSLAIGAECYANNANSDPTSTAGQTSRNDYNVAADAGVSEWAWGKADEKTGASSVTLSWTTPNIQRACVLGFSIDETVTSITGTAAAAMIKMSAQGTGAGSYTGTGAAAMIKMAAQGTGKETLSGSAAAAMARMTVAASGAGSFIATGAATMIKMAAQGTGFLKMTGTAIVNMIKMAVSAIGTSIVFEDYGVVRTVDPSKYSETAVYRLCGIMNCTDALYSIRMRLWDDTNNVMLAEITSTSTTPEEVFSDPLDFPSTEVLLRVEIGGFTGQGPYHADAADLVIDPV